MGNKYSSRVPVVEAADQRLKIARLSIAAACCVYSSDETGEKVIVKPEHVMFVVDFMNSIYCAKSFGYDKLSEQDRITSDTSDSNIAKLRAAFLALPIPDVNEMIDTLYQLPYFSRATLEDYTGLQRDDLKVLLKFMTTKHLVDKVRGDYRRLPLGTELLENLVNNKPTKQETDDAKRAYYGGADF
jgi:hypothetical protein